MIIPTSKLRRLSPVLLGTGMSLFLQGCGAERDAPFNPGDSDPNDIVKPVVTMELVLSGTGPILPFTNGKQIHILRDDAAFTQLWDAYTTAQFDAAQIDFDEGQVLLIDEGDIDNCDKVQFNTYSAHEESVNSVQVVLTYKDQEASSSASNRSSSSDSSSSSSASSSAPCVSTGTSRPFKFFYIHSRDTLLVEEDVN